MQFSTAYEWLEWAKSSHVREIDLGLERVRQVAHRLNLLSCPAKVITVGGTNGKGTAVSTLEAIYLAAGYRVATFTSPMLFKPHEQIKILGEEVTDDELCRAFSTVAANLTDISLTVFEFFTLAALVIFKWNATNLDLIILEVGLGGRLDAVNILDADVAVITSIDLDHMDYLGNSRESIAYEKAGILRAHKPAVCGDLNPPVTLLQQAKKLSVALCVQGEAFGFSDEGANWTWFSHEETITSLPHNGLLLQNLATCLMVVKLLRDCLPIKNETLALGLARVKLAARIEVVPGPVTTIYDVAHNPAAVTQLANYLQKNPISGKTLGVFSMLADKDIAESIQRIRENLEGWYVAPLTTARAASIEKLKEAFRQNQITIPIEFFCSIPEAFQAANYNAEQGDRVVVFGSFYTVASVREV